MSSRDNRDDNECEVCDRGPRRRIRSDTLRSPKQYNEAFTIVSVVAADTRGEMRAQMIGTTVSHYKILEKLGAGGMSVVYKAQDLRLDRYVALKFLPPGLSEDDYSRSRFVREAKAASVLDHSNICTIHEIGETDDGQLFIVMSHYDGETLRKRLERGPVPSAEAVNIARQICLGLLRAHEAGILHRDIKPANIMITTQGEVKILDFGLAKMLDQTKLTETGSKLGTIAYMSPEQVNGIDIDPRTDIWAVGIILFEMLTGELPFRSDSPGAILNAILNKDIPRPSSRRDEISPLLDKIVARAAQRDPADRYHSTEQILQDLTIASRDSTSPRINEITTTERLLEKGKKTRTGKSFIRRGFFILLTLVVLLLLFTDILRSDSWFKTQLSSLQNRINLGRIPEAPISGRIHEIPGLPQGIIKPAFAPSGDLLSVVAADGETGRHVLHLARLGTGELLPLVPEMDVRGPTPVFTSDGNHILFTSYSGDSASIMPDVWQVTVLGGRLERIIEHASAADFSSDGSRLVYAVVTEDGTRIQVRDPDGSIATIADMGFWPRWSSNDEWITYTSSNPEGGNGDLFVVRPDGSDRRRLTRRASQIYGLCWVPDSRWIVFSRDIQGAFGLWAASVQGEVIQLTRGPGECTQPAVSPDGSRIVFVHGFDATTIYLADSPLQEPVPVITTNLVLSASISPRGNKLALLTGGRGLDPSISIMNLSDGSEMMLSFLHAWRIRWCPDERYLLAAGWARETEDNRIWMIALDGGLPLSLTPGSDDFIDWPDLSHDGRYLIGAKDVDGEYELFVRDIDQKTERILARSSHINSARWSPDDRFITWSGERRPSDTKSCGIWIVSADGSEPRRLTTDGAYPAWDKDGESLVFVRYEENAGLWRISRNGGDPEQLQEPIESARSYKVDVFDMNDENSKILISVNKSRDSLYMIEDLNL